MCYISTKVEVLKESMKVYKVVTVEGDRFRSEWCPNQRSSWLGLPPGEILYYPIGERVVSPGGPGIMAYTRQTQWVETAYGEPLGTAILELEIPAGTKVRRSLVEDHIAAEEVKVLRPVVLRWR